MDIGKYGTVCIPKEMHEQFKKFAETNSIKMGQFAGNAIIEKMGRFNGDEA